MQKVQIAIKATPDAVWHALTAGDVTPAYYVGYTAEFDLTPGGEYRYTDADGETKIAGRVVAVESGRALTTTFNPTWAPDVAALPETTVTFRLAAPPMPMPGVTLLSVEHEGLPDAEVAAHLELGWVAILSGLKTLLETEAPMVAPPVAA